MALLNLLVTLSLLFVAIETKEELNLDDVTTIVGEKFDYQIGNEEFLSTYKIYRIVQRGQRKLPAWLTFDTNSSMLIGYPKTEDIGLYTLRLRAQCIDPAVTYCQDKLSRTFHVTVIEPLKSAESRGRHTFTKHEKEGKWIYTNMHNGNTRLYVEYDISRHAAPDESPSLEKSIDHLKVIVGRYFKFQIPDGTFSDKEDGNTRNLSLRISLTYSKPFPEDAWLMFNETSQTFYGIPLKNDSDGESVISEFTLIAEDSQGQVAKDAISLTYEYEKDVNHRISVAFNGSYEKFTNDRMNLIKVAEKIADFYNDENLNFLTFSNVETGSVVIVWSNNSLIGTTCIKSKIQELYNRLSDDNGTISDQFVALFTDFTPINTSFEFLGACLLPITSFAPPTKSPVSETDNRMWIEIVLPALIAILVIVIIALLLLICCRHRRPSKEIKDADKPAFLEDRRPIIFPEELEMVDPSLKPKTPLVLPSDYLTETPPAVPPHGRPAPPYRTPMLDEDRFPGEDENPPHLSTYGGHSQQTEPPPYRLPPPYYNPHRMA
ncbi:dystroglycan 1-like isoform X3 [Mercenaria mercenaria]|uniref:dystroglycan 1-like isoform X3 n=1 Tax=Mercenaria mercenaria TaxID=6596 RepID=UPI001E1D48DE|nr:dystroglycan 1-like isoform X3 [Mercenaria mercenaria]